MQDAAFKAISFIRFRTSGNYRTATLPSVSVPGFVRVAFAFHQIRQVTTVQACRLGSVWEASAFGTACCRYWRVSINGAILSHWLALGVKAPGKTLIGETGDRSPSP